ncbi:MAG: iron-sulfur cluster assembly accessory protein [Candidatus Sericytochromatia bacterium]|nr:iron-sulfur cluster assembly accessory protein [Candidatus Sericytochromatia bacterium]
MIIIEDSAREKILAMLNAEGKAQSALRIRITGRGASGYQHKLSLVEPGYEKAEDILSEYDGIRVLVDPKTAANIEGARIEFVDDLYGGGFKVTNPNQPQWSNELERQVQELIDTQIAPSLAAHGGYLELLEVKEGKAFVHFGGGCQGCGMADVTLKQGVEKLIKDTLPEITAVLDTTDHAQGENPYYRPTPAKV